MSEQQIEKGELPPNATVEQKLDHYFKVGKNPKFSACPWPTFAEHFPEMAAKLIKKDENGIDVPNADKDENNRGVASLTEHGYRFGVNKRDDEVYGTMYSVWRMKWESANGQAGGSAARFAPRRLTGIFANTPEKVMAFLDVHKDEIWKYKETFWSESLQQPISVIIKDEKIGAS